MALFNKAKRLYWKLLFGYFGEITPSVFANCSIQALPYRIDNMIPMELPQNDDNENSEEKNRLKLKLFLLNTQLFYYRDELRDKGVDLVCEAKFGKIVSGYRFYIQLKATRQINSVATLDVKNLNYLLNHNVPSFYVFYHERTDELYFENTTDIVNNLNTVRPNWKNQKTFRWRFNKKLNENGAKELFNLVCGFYLLKSASRKPSDLCAPIYLHFIDDELNRAISVNLSAHQLIEVLLLSFVFTDSYFLLGLSRIWEFQPFQTNQYLVDLFSLLIQSSEVFLVSRQRTLAEFLNWHGNAYRDDSSRIIYLDKPDQKLLQIEPQLFKKDGTTKRIYHMLDDEFAKISSENSALKYLLEKLLSSHESRPAVENLIFQIIKERGIKNIQPNTIKQLSVLISKAYVFHHMEEFSSDIITGIPGFQKVDNLSFTRPYYDYRIYKSFFNIYISETIQSYPSIKVFEDILVKRHSNSQRLFILKLNQFIANNLISVLNFEKASYSEIYEAIRRLVKVPKNKLSLADKNIFELLTNAIN